MSRERIEAKGLVYRGSYFAGFSQKFRMKIDAKELSFSNITIFNDI